MATLRGVFDLSPLLRLRRPATGSVECMMSLRLAMPLDRAGGIMTAEDDASIGKGVLDVAVLRIWWVIRGWWGGQEFVR